MIENYVIGLGQIGKPLREILNCEGWDIAQPDPQRRAVRLLHICFPYSELFVAQAATYAFLHAARNIIIHSTVLPGTTKRLQRELASCGLSSHCDAIYSPVRGRHGNMKRDMMYFTKFVAAPVDMAASFAAAMLAVAGFKVQIHPDPTGLELSKLFQTTATAVQVALAQEMDRYCEELDVDFLGSQVLLDMPNLPHAIHQPGFIGGHCLMENLSFLDRVLRRGMTAWIRNSNSLRDAVHGREEERLYPIPWRQYV